MEVLEPNRIWHTIRGELLTEKERLKTFTNGLWPVSFIKPEDLAKTGFYYTNRGDRVRCIYCNILIGEWDIDDIPEEEHRLHSPDCEFLNTGSRSVLSDPEPIVLNVNRNRCSPVCPVYIKESSRISSFVGCHPDEIKVSGRSLAKAGFYYSGLTDHVCCFYCNLRLKDFEEGDDPWLLHARCRGTCHFLRLMKGKKYIENARRNEEDRDEEEEEEISLPTNSVDRLLCGICLDYERGVVFQPCGHCFCCIMCASTCNNLCPVCRNDVANCVPVYLS